MAAVPLTGDEDASAEALAVFNEIRERRGTDYINNFWRALANDPAHLRVIWDRVQTVMAPGELDPLVKELIYIAVSTANNCGYCIHSHSAAARSKGMTPSMHAELLQVIALASQTNALATGMGVPVDDVFDVSHAIGDRSPGS